VRAAIELRGEWRANGVPMEARTSRLLAALCELHAEAGVGGRTSARDTTQRASRRGGHVAIVGAGPGDPALMTRRGAVRLAEADLVLYDALVAPEVVAMATRAQRVFVGRRRGRESVSQQAIHRVMIGAARRGRQVVRLKGGDPFVFGRGGEDAMALADAGVPFEIVPGVSAAFGAPALASIPVTHRQVSSAVLVTTGHDPARLRRLADAIPAGSVTLVIMMALADRAAAARALVNAGWTSRTPVAVIRGASTPHQLTWTGTLGELIDERDPPFDARLPGTLVVGDVVSLRERIVGRRSVAAPAAAIEVGHG
jgi:uroporphyrin-III C-methyltransferase/precorrin-2 dehydrogenase/sirohydrochlorin ferrochelatase